MSTIPQEPLLPGFDNQEQADAYDRWFRTQVQKALDDSRPPVPHDQAMTLLNKRIAKKKVRRNYLPLEAIASVIKA